ncbi:translation initiation factor IF-2-like [Panthera leo]|uniref:translation initiation factor IF-2-like n=1 Tax=Panthera leo TaxID=9689 RepID=UPI001C698007|nr:translation initiation factor IF-2-like [Panthera leo]
MRQQEGSKETFREDDDQRGGEIAPFNDSCISYWDEGVRASSVLPLPPAPSARGARGAHATSPPWGSARGRILLRPPPPHLCLPDLGRPGATRRAPRPAAAGRRPAPSDAARRRSARPGPVPRFFALRTSARATARRNSQSIPSRALQSAPRHASAPPRPSALAPASGHCGWRVSHLRTPESRRNSVGRKGARAEGRRELREPAPRRGPSTRVSAATSTTPRACAISSASPAPPSADPRLPERLGESGGQGRKSWLEGALRAVHVREQRPILSALLEPRLCDSCILRQLPPKVHVRYVVKVSGV